MGRFRTGLLAGGILGIIGVSMAMGDKRTRRRMVKDGRIMRKGAERLFDKLDMI
ncbi:MAG: hypothetical protein LUD81_03635 [Clostridiales bacterium]|nr:hypothetical protein [Clostridiales bacterium]